jgi:hypothetical protein
MTTHPRERLSALLDGELPPDEEAAVRRHLAGCTECARELAIMRDLGGAMKTMTAHGEGNVWSGVHARITRPLGWLLLGAGLALWIVLALIGWWRAALTAAWLAITGVVVGIVLLAVGIAHEQYRDWQQTRYRDVER